MKKTLFIFTLFSFLLVMSACSIQDREKQHNISTPAAPEQPETQENEIEVLDLPNEEENGNLAPTELPPPPPLPDMGEFMKDIE